MSTGSRQARGIYSIIVLVILLFLVQVPLVLGQGELDKQAKVFYRNEWTVGLSLNSNGWGAGYRYGKRLDGFRKQLYETELLITKHPKEIKVTSQLNPTVKTFVLGKQYSAFNLRGGTGLQKELFSKQDKGGIAVRYFYTGGITLALLKPIYYEYMNLDGSSKYELFDLDVYNRTRGIIGKGPAFMGVGKTRVIPGLYAKAGMNFEYSKIDVVIHALEAGVILEGYTTKIPIMATEHNNQIFFTLFVSYRFGRILDPLAPKKTRDWDSLYNN